MQAIALDHGRLAIIQPLLVTTVVFALPLGYFLTAQEVGRREVVGAVVVVLGLALYAIFGAPAGGNENAPNDEWAIALAVVAVACGALYAAARRSDGARQAACYGVVSGILFGVSACPVKRTLEALHDGGVSEVLSQWEFYAMAITGILAFVIQQISLSAGFSRHVRGDGLGCESHRLDRHRRAPLRRAPQPARLARVRGTLWARARDARCGRDLRSA